MGIVGRSFLDPGDRLTGRKTSPEPVTVLVRWGGGGGPRNVLVRRPDGTCQVIPFRRLRKRTDPTIPPTPGGQMLTLTAVGNLTTDPEMRITPSGVAVTRFTLAVNHRQRVDGQWVDGAPSFVTVEAWRSLAEHAMETLTKGMRVIAHGRWREDRWEQDGQMRSRWILTADALGPDLTWATATVTKATRMRQVPPGAPWAASTPAQNGPAGGLGGDRATGQPENPPF